MRKIALLMDGWKRYFTYAWPSGILKRICETDEQVNLYIFNSSGNWSKDGLYNVAEYNIFSLPDLQEFDGIILDLNNIEFPGMAADVAKRAASSGKPVISIGNEMEGFYYVGIDNKKAMEEMMDHLVKVHGCRTFWFVMGSEGNYENRKRIEGICSYLDSLYIPYSESQFYYESFEYQCGVHGFRHFAENSQMLPDAIVCANDNIAVGVCEEAEKYGFHAPEDFLVTGFDNFDKASYYNPRITTIGHIREDVGYVCADLFLRLWKGELVPRQIYTKTRCIFLESCGCEDRQGLKERDYLKSKITYGIETDRFMEEVRTLEYELMKCNSFREMMDCIPKCLPSMHCDAMYLVLDNHLNDFKDKKKQETDFMEEEQFHIHGYPETMKMEFSYEAPAVRRMLDGGLHGCKNETQEIHGIFPMFDSEKPGINLLFLPLHFRQRTIGYFVIRNAVYLMEKQYLHHIIGTLTRAMENLHKQEKLEWMNRRLTELYVRDAMTGMYNRLGYKKYGEKLFHTMRREKNYLVMFIDLDRLKYINDTFGHDLGDFTIRAVANAILGTLKEDDIPVRLGGDEFLIIREAMPEEEISAMVDKIRKKVKRAGEDARLAFEMSISAGYVITDKNSEKSLEEYVGEADAMMYQEKTAKKVEREA